MPWVGFYRVHLFSAFHPKANAVKKLVSLAVSLTILALVYWKIDAAKILPVFERSSWQWLLVSLGMVVPLTLATAWRLKILMPRGHRLPFGEANRLILLASVLNMVLPSKMGDVAKAAFMAERGHLKGSLAVALVIFEKACDMASLLVWCAFGLLFYPDKDAVFWFFTAMVAGGMVFLALLLGSPRFAGTFFALGARFAPRKIGGKLAAMEGAWAEMHAAFWGDRFRLVVVAATSVGIWFLHLLQIWMFTIALRTEVPLLSALALAPLALLAGLLPLTFAGIGTRDAALVLLFGPYMTAADAAALGVLCTLRYFLPALGGLPFIGGRVAALGKIRGKKPDSFSLATARPENSLPGNP